MSLPLAGRTSSSLRYAVSIHHVRATCFQCNVYIFIFKLMVGFSHNSIQDTPKTFPTPLMVARPRSAPSDLRFTTGSGRMMDGKKLFSKCTLIYVCPGISCLSCHILTCSFYYSQESTERYHRGTEESIPVRKRIRCNRYIGLQDCRQYSAILKVFQGFVVL